MTKVKKKSRLVKAIEKDSAIEKEFKIAFLPFFEKHPPFKVYHLFHNLRDSFMPKDKEEETLYFVKGLESNFLQLAGINSNWKEFRKLDVKKVFSSIHFHFPLYFIDDIQLLLAKITNEIDWAEGDLAILSDLQRAALNYFFLQSAKERKLTEIEERYVKGADN